MAQVFRMTKEGLEKLKKRLTELGAEKNENIAAVQEARSQGDLSENADYSAARERQKQIDYEIQEIEMKIKNHVIIKENVIKVEFVDDNDVEDYVIVGSTEADPLNNRISIESPLAKAFIEIDGDQLKYRSDLLNKETIVRAETGEPIRVILREITAI